MNPKVDWFFEKDTQWQKEYQQLRAIVLACGLTEELKWGVPCYTLPSPDGGKSRNIVLIHGFKEYCALLFHKGALLADTHGLLIQQTKNVQAARQIRFANGKEIVKSKNILKAYVKEAMAVEKAGLKVNLKKTSEFTMPKEFRKDLHENPTLKKAFNSLTPGRQRGYLLYFSSPKQSKARESRVARCIPKILKGKGLNDQ